MPEPRTMLDVACALGRIVSGEREWNLAFKWAAEMRHYKEFMDLCDALSKIPADATEQFEELRAEVVQLRAKLEAACADAERLSIESAGEQARRITAGPLRRK